MIAERQKQNTESFLSLVEERSGQPIHRCYQCEKCANGCPMLGHMDLSTNQLFLWIQLDAQEEALAANTPWLCASCYTCSVRCPNQIDIAQVMDALRGIARERGHDSPIEGFIEFHETFLDMVRRRGRVNEVALMTRLHKNPLALLSQSRLGWAMFRRGRLALLSPGVRDREAIRAIFASMEAGDGEPTTEEEDSYEL